MVEQWGEGLPDAVDLVATVKSDVLLRDLTVQSQVAGRTGGSHAEAFNQVRAAKLAEEVEPEVDVGQPLALHVAQALDARAYAADDISHEQDSLSVGLLIGTYRSQYIINMIT